MTNSKQTIWITTSWPTAVLQNQKVEFAFNSRDSTICGIGEFRVFQNPDGRQEIEIVTTETDSQGHFIDTILTIDQNQAGNIATHPDQTIAAYKLIL